MHATSLNVDRWPCWMRWSFIALGVIALCSCRGRTIRSERTNPIGCHVQQASACQPAPACPLEPFLPEAPWPDEVLCDGGDLGLPAGVRKDGSVAGLEPTETIAAFDTLDGRTLVQPTNRICIYAPRFGAVRRVMNATFQQQHDFVNGVRRDVGFGSLSDEKQPATSSRRLDSQTSRGTKPTSLLLGRQQGGEVDGAQALAVHAGALLPYANLEVMRTGAIDNREAPLLAEAIVSAISWSGDLGVQVAIEGLQALAAVDQKHLAVIYRIDEPNRPQLRIIKLASRSSAQPGEIIDFSIRYDNVGNQVIQDVVIEDNLTTRLSYVSGSEKTNRKATFTSVMNNTGSLRLRWEISEPLKPGDGDVITFQCIVR
ncbi:MAG: hypothetical protein JW829_15585 [Pirellulales bacterium]|nr:hypothetical protein [Pirellulales bacterium]